MSIELIHGDCLVEMKKIPDKSIDLVLTDPPYGTTKCDWDILPNLSILWNELWKISKSTFIFTATQPFATDLINSNRNQFRYEWIWHKSKCGSAFTSKYRPQQKHENILVFGEGKIPYYFILREGKPYYRKRLPNKEGKKPNNHKLGVISASETHNSGFRYPETVIYFQQKWRRQDQLHPTQKPVELMKYLIKTYSKIGDIILDPFMGSGTTGVACKELGRNFIGIEIDKNYFEIAQKRINNTQEMMI